MVLEDIHLKRVNFMVTTTCNLHCRMCDVPEFNNRENNLTLEKIKEIIWQAAQAGAEILEISGGEPMMRKDIYEIIAFAASLKLKVMMVSNGVLIGPSEAQKLLEAGVSLIPMSLEGPEELNDKIRGKGNFKKTLSAIKSFLANSTKIPELQVSAGITLSRHNYKIVRTFSKYLLEDVGVHCITINPFTGTMMSQENFKARKDEFIIPEELIPDLIFEMEQLAQYSESRPGKLPSPRYIRRIPEYFDGNKILPSGGCGMPLTFIGISPRGLVFPCWHGPVIGDLKQSVLSEILASTARKEYVEKALSGDCPGCLSSCYSEIF